VPPEKLTWFVFAHGTSAANAALITDHGLDENLARQHQCGSTHPGSFHAFELSQGNEREARQLAYEFGLRHDEAPVVLIGKLPWEFFEELRRRKDALVEAIVGLKPTDPPQVIFFPSAFAEFNRRVHWVRILRPGR
jgi:hypothetical protein